MNYFDTLPTPEVPGSNSVIANFLTEKAKILAARNSPFNCTEIDHSDNCANLTRIGLSGKLFSLV